MVVDVEATTAPQGRPPPPPCPPRPAPIAPPTDSGGIPTVITELQNGQQQLTQQMAMLASTFANLQLSLQAVLPVAKAAPQAGAASGPGGAPAPATASLPASTAAAPPRTSPTGAPGTPRAQGASPVTALQGLSPNDHQGHPEVFRFRADSGAPERARSADAGAANFIFTSPNGRKTPDRTKWQQMAGAMPGQTSLSASLRRGADGHAEGESQQKYQAVDDEDPVVIVSPEAPVFPQPSGAGA